MASERRRRIFLKFFFLIAVFAFAVLGLIYLFLQLPGLTNDERARLTEHVPSNFGEAWKLRELSTIKDIFYVLSEYKQDHPLAVAAFLSYIYLLYQAFPLFMFPFAGCATGVTLLLGALYTPYFAIGLASLLAAVGPSMAYFLFGMAGKPFLMRFLPNQVRQLRDVFHPRLAASLRMASVKELHFAATSKRTICGVDVDLFLTILFLRISPFPNLVINAASPVLDVPFDLFFVATWFGLLPNTILFVSMGTALSSLDSLESGWKPLLFLCVTAFAVVLLKMYISKANPNIKAKEMNTSALYENISEDVGT